MRMVPSYVLVILSAEKLATNNGPLCVDSAMTQDFLHQFANWFDTILVLNSLADMHIGLSLGLMAAALRRKRSMLGSTGLDAHHPQPPILVYTMPTISICGVLYRKYRFQGSMSEGGQQPMNCCLNPCRT